MPRGFFKKKSASIDLDHHHVHVFHYTHILVFTMGCLYVVGSAITMLRLKSVIAG